MILKYFILREEMGGVLQRSREEDLPSDINDKDVRAKIIASWTEANIISFPWTAEQAKSTSTLSKQTLEKAADNIALLFCHHRIDLKILEVFAGNCCASQIIYRAIKDQVISWICTDAININKTIVSDKMRFEHLNAVQGVAKFGNEANVLLLISPPPYSSTKEGDLGYGDYYACHDFLHNNQRQKYIIFIGELGASDGSQGMYKYLTLHPDLNLITRVMLDNSPDVFGDLGEKELFIFATN